VAAPSSFGYGVFRFVAEYFREPDSFLGLLALGMSMGQWLCVPMIAAGAALWWFGRTARQHDDATDLLRHRDHRADADKGGDRIIEIGCLEMVDRRMTGNNLHLYLNPERSSHPDALKVHGLTDEFLADKPLFADVADELLAYLAGAEVIIHNAASTWASSMPSFGARVAPACASMAARITDSLLIAREMFPGKANSLDALCRRLEVDNTNRTLHGALLDAGLLAEVYIRMTRGQARWPWTRRPQRLRPASATPSRRSTCAGWCWPWWSPPPTSWRPTSPCWPTWTRPAAARRCGRLWHNARLSRLGRGG
jgi:DNA polymerase III epsilon subunit